MIFEVWAKVMIMPTLILRIVLVLKIESLLYVHFYCSFINKARVVERF